MKKGVRRSLVFKWVLFSVLLSTIPLTISGFQIIQIYQKDLKKSIIEAEEMKANMVIERTEANFDQIFNDLLSIKEDEISMKFGSSHTQSHLEAIVYQSDYIAELTLWDEKGRETLKVSKLDVVGPSSQESQSKSKMLEAALKGQTYLGDFYLSTNMAPTMEVAFPIGEYKGNPLGVVSAKINLRDLWNLLPKTQVSKRGSSYVVNKSGDLVAHSDIAQVLSKSSMRDLPIIEQVISGKEGSIEFETPHGEKFIAVYKPIRKLGWSVVVQAPVEEAYTPIQEVSYQAMRWIFIVFAISIILSLFLTRKMVLPIKRLSDEMGKVSEGNLEVHVQATTKDEVGMLAGSFNQMIHDLKMSQSALKEAEEKYRTVIEGVHDGIAVLGVDFKFKYANKRLTQMLGFTLDELVGMDFRSILAEESKQVVIDRYLKWVRKEEDSPHFEFNLIRKDRKIRNIETRNKEMRDSQGNLSFVALMMDITEKKKMEEQMFQTEKLRALGEMASGVAHDFNNALAAILGNTQLLLYTVEDKEVRETLKTIETVTKDSAQTVKRLQEFTRKKVHQNLFKLNVNAIIKDVIEITKPKWKDDAQGRGIQIEMVLNLEKVSPVGGNGSEMREVITNMIFNAIEAMPEGGRLDIRTREGNGKVYAQITDTGIGMTEENRKKIFEPFFTTKPFSNSGLGLSMSYGIIKRFGGEIEVESKVGKGTTFTLILPVDLESKEEMSFDSNIIKGKTSRILVIEDEETVRNVLAQMLSKINHEVTVAKDGEEGVRLFGELEFDLVLTDLGMPGMSGWEVCQKIKKINPFIPVGMITGWGMELSQDKMDENGLNFIISKPFDFNQVLKVISETMESRANIPS